MVLNWIIDREIDSLFIKTASQPKAELRNYLQKLYNT